MNERERILSKHYEDGTNEEQRLSKDKAHSVEYLTTKKYIEKYLKKGDKILEVGAGTGAYSLHYANLGYNVNSIEFLKGNLNILKSKITKNMNITAEQGDALDLSRFKDNTFDVTLVLGPLYHLFTEQDKRKAIEEAIRVTKKDGLIFLAYLTSDSAFISYCLKKHHLLDKDLYDKNFKLKDIPEEVFSEFHIEEFKNIMNSYNIEYLHNVATDGLAGILREYVNDLTDEEFNVFLNYHYSTCEREDLQGYSSHMLYICRKK
ncbi:MAG: class I SAM-dependent methyltransferase [Bacilli bacterium]|nr:class I SAM-dependent methyltransferase [Bacilli bacterium]